METYWAAASDEDLPAKIEEKAEQYYETLNTDNRLELWRNSYRHHYGLDAKWRHVSAKPMSDGEQGELIKVRSCQSSNLAQHLINLTCQSRPSFEARSLNTDYESQAGCIVGQQVLEAFMRDKKLESLFRLGDEYAVVYSEGYVVTDWDPTKGDPYMKHPETGQPINGGDVDVRVFLPSDVVREYYQDEDNKADWYIIRRRVNKFKLAAQFPKFADDLLSMTSDSKTMLLDDINDFEAKGDDDRVTVWTLYHDRCPQLPEGKKAIICGGKTLKAEAFPFKKYNVHRVSPRVQVKSPYGYTGIFDLMGLNDVIDMLLSSVVSNNNNHAIQNVWTKPGSQLSVRQISGGMNHLESVEKPEPVQLTQSAPETYNLLKYLDTLCETLSGVNSVARGNPDGGLKGASGSALALLQSMTIQFASALQESHAQMIEAVGDSIIDILQVKASVPRIAMVAGKNNRAYAKTFSNKDLMAINRVVVDMGNPAARTSAGRMQMADDLLQKGLIKRPQQYFEVIATGKLEPITESEVSENLLIKAENDAMKDGKPATVINIDNHPLHVQEHKAILSDPETRSRPEIIRNVLGHIQEHINEWVQMRPELLQMLGYQIPPMPGGSAPGAPPAGGPPPPPQGEQAGGPPPDSGMPPEIQAQLPQMPVNPLSGDQAPAPAA